MPFGGEEEEEKEEEKVLCARFKVLFYIESMAYLHTYIYISVVWYSRNNCRIFCQQDLSFFFLGSRSCVFVE